MLIIRELKLEEIIAVGGFGEGELEISIHAIMRAAAIQTMKIKALGDHSLRWNGGVLVV